MGAGAFGSTFGFSFSPVSLLMAEDPGTIFYDNQDDFQDFHYSPFTVRE